MPLRKSHFEELREVLGWAMAIFGLLLIPLILLDLLSPYPRDISVLYWTFSLALILAIIIRYLEQIVRWYENLPK